MLNYRNLGALGILLLLATGTSSCGRNESAQTTTPPPEANQPPPASALTDANIAAIIAAANVSDITNAEAAQGISRNRDVKAFARQMIADHTTANKKATDLATKLGLTPMANDVSRGILASADSTRNAIKSLQGADFDRAYIESEVFVHQEVLSMLDNILIPGAQNSELKALLEGVRPVIADHLEHAQSIQGRNPL